MSIIKKAEYYEARKRYPKSFGVIHYASGRVKRFCMEDTPKTFDTFCLKCEPLWERRTEDYDVWVYTLPHCGAKMDEEPGDEDI